MKTTMMKIAVAAALALPVGAQAALYLVTGSLNAVQEVQTPAVVSPAIGDFHAIYNDVTNIFTYLSLAGGNLVGSSISGLHIHGVGTTGGPVGANSGIALGLPHLTIVTNPGLPGGAFNFTATNLGGSPAGPDSQAAFIELEEGHLKAGRSYINLHTNLYPSGEIRGQLQVTLVPEPETYALMLAGLGLVGWAAARRRRAEV